MATRAVLDADVWVAALLSPSGASAELLLALEDRQFQAVWSAPLLREVEEALRDPKIRQRYHVRLLEVRLLVEIAARYGREVTITGRTSLSDDPGDDKIIETALRGKARYLVSFNVRHFSRGRAASHLSRSGVAVLFPAQFLRIVRPLVEPARRRAGKLATRLVNLRGKGR